MKCLGPLWTAYLCLYLVHCFLGQNLCWSAVVFFRDMFHSGVVAGAREALISGVPSVSISLNWKKEGSQDSDFKDAVDACFPLLDGAIRDIEKGIFPKNCSLHLEVPTSPSGSKLLDNDQGEDDEDLDFRALENGFVAVTPLCLPVHDESEIRTAVSDWMVANALKALPLNWGVLLQLPMLSGMCLRR